MNKSELIQKLAEHCNLSTDEAALCVSIFVDEMKKALLEGNRIEIRGFGSFKMKEFQGYTGRNPKTGEQVQVKPKKMPFFRAGKELKDYVNDDVQRSPALMRGFFVSSRSETHRPRKQPLAIAPRDALVFIAQAKGVQRRRI